jgi:hypothetical protein
LCPVLFLEALLLKNLDFRACLGGVSATAIWTRTEFYFEFFSSFFGASVLLLGYYIVEEARYN